MMAMSMAGMGCRTYYLALPTIREIKPSPSLYSLYVSFGYYDTFLFLSTNIPLFASQSNASIKNTNEKTTETELTYIDAQDWPLPICDLSSEQPVVERIRAYTRLAFQAKTLVCPCRSYIRYAALGDEDARYSWSRTARSGHACHRRHPKKNINQQKLLKK